MKLPVLTIALFACIICIFLAWFFSHRARHKERMLLIEKGLGDTDRREPFNFPWLKIGIVVIGLGIGLLIIAILVKLFGDLNTLPVAILVICGGVSMIIANNVNKGKPKS